MDHRIFLLLCNVGGKDEMTLTATTTASPEDVIIDRMTPVGGNITIHWGDGSSTVQAPGDEASETHAYATAGTYRIRIAPASRIQQVDVHRSNISGVRSAQLASSPITYFRCYSIGNDAPNVIDSQHMASWTPTQWYLFTMPAGGTYTIDSQHMSAWTPTNWLMYTMPAGTYVIDSDDMKLWTPGYWQLGGMSAGTYTIDSDDMKNWTPTTWYLHDMPAGTYTIDSDDMKNWTPTHWRLRSMPAGTYTIDSDDMSGWTPTNWYLYSMPAGTYAIDSSHMASWTPTHWWLYNMPAGTYAIDSDDMKAWTPTHWYLYSMPAGTYTIDSQHMASWTPTIWYLFNMPAASTTWTLDGDDFAGYTTCTNFLIHDNDLSTAQVDEVLYGLYQATTARTVNGGTINVGGSNDAPTGVFQAAAACPVTDATDGKEVCHELLNDGCDAIAAGKTWATVTFTA